MRSVTAEVQKLLTTHPSFDASSVRVRFIRLGPSSLDVEIFAYLYSRDWNHFLEIQEDMLLRVMEIIQQAGVEIAFPSQTTYLATHPSDGLSLKVHDGGGRRRTDRIRIEETVHH